MFEATPNNTIKFLKQSKKVTDIFTLLEIDAAVDDIDLHMTPIDTFSLFESRRDMHRVRCNRELGMPGIWQGLIHPGI
jgi:hypothetical protein